MSAVFAFSPKTIWHGVKYDVLVFIYNSYAGFLGEFLSNQDPVQCLMFAVC